MRSTFTFVQANPPFAATDACNLFLLGYVPQLVSPVITFAVFIGSARNGTTNPDPARMFTSLSLLFLVSDPLFNFFSGLIEFMTALGCLNRVEQFLLSPSRVDTRTVRKIESASSPGSSSGSPNSEKKIHEDCIRVHDGTFGWNAEDDPVLRNLQITIHPGDIVFVLGPVGCGKSTLIKALLGETPVSSGTMTLSHLDISLCEQSPWIMVGTEEPSWFDGMYTDLSLTEQVNPH